MTTNQKRLVIAFALLLFIYVGLALSTAHADRGSPWRQDAAQVVGAILVVVAIIAAIVFAPRYLTQQALQAAREVLEEPPEQRAQHVKGEARTTRTAAVGLAVFLAMAAVYQCFFTPDAQYSRVRSELDQLEGHEQEAVASLVQHGQDLGSARTVVAIRIKRLRTEADRLWPETKAAQKAAPQLPPGVLQP